MPIATLRTSTRAQKLAEGILAELAMPAPEGWPAGETLPGELLTAPVRSVSVAELADGDPGRGELVGWRSMWLAADGVIGATIDFRRTRGGRPRFHSYSVGRKAALFADRLRRAQTAAADEPLYALGILRVPAAHLEALWLRPFRRSARGRLFGLSDDLTDEAWIREAQRRARDLRDTPARPVRQSA